MKSIRSVTLVLAVAWALAVPVTASARTPVPDGFMPASTSWLTPRHGYLLGYAGTTGYLLETTDGGTRWTRLTAPSISLPDNHNHVSITFADTRHAFVSDGTVIQESTDGGRHWSSVTLDGIASPYYLNRIALAGDHVLTVASTLSQPDQNTTRLYSGTLGARTLRPVPGVSVSGGSTYGDMAVGGGVQVSFGTTDTGSKFWTSRDGVHFTASPAACAPTDQTSLDGVKQGRVLALCTGDPADPAPGESHKQLTTAASFGGRFAPTGAEAPLPGILQGFAAGSATGATIAATGGDAELLYSTSDGGATWSATRLDIDAFGLYDLHYTSAMVGTVVAGEPSGYGGSAVYRTTDGGRTWLAVTFGEQG